MGYPYCKELPKSAKKANAHRNWLPPLILFLCTPALARTARTVSLGKVNNLKKMREPMSETTPGRRYKDRNLKLVARVGNPLPDGRLLTCSNAPAGDLTVPTDCACGPDGPGGEEMMKGDKSTCQWPGTSLQSYHRHPSRAGTADARSPLSFKLEEMVRWSLGSSPFPGSGIYPVLLHCTGSWASPPIRARTAALPSPDRICWPPDGNGTNTESRHGGSLTPSRT